MHIHPAHSRFHCIYDSIVSFEDGLQNMLIKKQEILAVKTLRDTDYELLSNASSPSKQKWEGRGGNKHAPKCITYIIYKTLITCKLPIYLQKQFEIFKN